MSTSVQGKTTNAAVTSYRVSCGELGFMKKGDDFVPTPPKGTEGYNKVYKQQKHLEKASWELACKATKSSVNLKKDRMEIEEQLKVIKEKTKIPTRAQVALLRTWEKNGVPKDLQLFSVGEKVEIRRKSAIESKPIIDARRLLRKQKKEAKKAKEKADKEKKAKIKQEKLEARRAKLKVKREAVRAAKIASGEIVPKIKKAPKKTVAKKTTTKKVSKAKKTKKKTKAKKTKKAKANAMQVEGQPPIDV